MQNPSTTGGDAALGPAAVAPGDTAEDWGEPAYTPTSDPADHDLYRRPTSPAGPSAAVASTAPVAAPPGAVDTGSGGDSVPETRSALDELDLAGWSTRPMEPDPVPPYGVAPHSVVLEAATPESTRPDAQAPEYLAPQYRTPQHPAPQYPAAAFVAPEHVAPESRAPENLPPIGDYWPDGSRKPDASQHTAWPVRSDRTLADELLYTSDDDPVTAMPGGSGGSWPVAEPGAVFRRRRGLVVAAAVALVALAGAGIVTTVIKVTSDTPSTASSPVLAPPLPTEPTGAPSTIPVEPPTTGPAGGATDPSPAGPDTEHVVSAPLGGRSDGRFELVNGTTMVTMRLDPLGDALYRISTPAGASVLPKVIADGEHLRLFLVRSGIQGVGAVTIALNDKVRWNLRMIGGTDQSVIDLSGGRVDAVELAGGATRIDLTLPRPDGTLPVRMTGGVNQFVVHTAASVPVRVRVGSGAGRVVLDGRQRNGIAPGASFTTAQWSNGGDRIDLDAVAGMATLTVDRR